jgi:hypothetical protein
MVEAPEDPHARSIDRAFPGRILREPVPPKIRRRRAIAFSLALDLTFRCCVANARPRVVLHSVAGHAGSALERWLEATFAPFGQLRPLIGPFPRPIVRLSGPAALRGHRPGAARRCRKTRDDRSAPAACGCRTRVGPSGEAKCSRSGLRASPWAAVQEAAQPRLGLMPTGPDTPRRPQPQPTAKIASSAPSSRSRLRRLESPLRVVILRTTTKADYESRIEGTAWK